ncbi:ribonucleoside-triphosphate reductase, adenosylcobalamin-dependent [Halothece sp. PCC 7418]|uniref:ribonucleoside-triphosphate reductase, adenosylcobalamin-dependent n=1 Tax=Halothece sp. (strain PCC 7418) TaxID=65093 RepID=UPI0002A07E7A|nr:ribonucleoside-triphosphate reductase, adenosylcobalamin-dependent [Halothece sp. PCC 7418]AFZ42518.1 ribonucleoside-triphosphate reductase, adenosylcobalamin-dependent [Halothece sp. PCC 7418]
MVRELERKQSTNFPENAPVANPVFFRTYSRRTEDGRETWEQVRDRCISGLVKLGQLTAEEAQLLEKTMTHLKSLPAGRWLWVGGTQWLENPKNYSGAYNCTSTNVVDWRAFGLMMDLAMMGCGTGAVLEEKYINQLPAIRNYLNISIVNEIGTVLPEARQEETTVRISDPKKVKICIGDSREGWVQSYQALLELSSNEDLDTTVNIEIDPSHVRPAGEVLKGFGGVANPIKIPELYPRLAKILNRAQGRKLNAEECCLLIDEAAATVVAGNIRRCLPEYALVHTARGLVAIKDIKVGDRVQTPLGFRRVVDKFDQGIQDVREIETNGTYPQATENHRMAVLSSANGDYVWKQVGELESGDRLLHNTKILAGIPTQLPADETSLRPLQSRTAKAISIPDLNPDVAWLIGFTHGDGYVSLGRNKHNKPYGSINWATDAELAPLIEEKLNRALANFGVSATKQTSENENTVRFVCSSIRLTEYFFKNIKRPKEPIEIPDFILQGSVETRAAYLAGIMDSDGSVKNRPPHLVCTVYPQFARQIASVLSSLGIAGRIKKTIPQKLNWRTRYHVCLPALKGEYNKLIASHAVKGELKVGLKMYGFTLTGEMMREAYTYSEMQKMGFQGSRKVDSNYERYRVESEVEMDIPVTFKQLGQVFAVQTYDIEVEDAHCFYCDGYLTHNSAGMRQFDSDSPLLKQNLWQPDAEGNWRIDPDRDALRMANHTRVYHHQPSLEDCVEAVRSQFYSGEGAIQYAPEAIARGNADLLNTFELKEQFIQAYQLGHGEKFLRNLLPESPSQRELNHRLERYALNPCGEITGSNFHCNLSEIHLNLIDPENEQEQTEAFQAGALAVATLLNHQFQEPRYQYSRELDPIVGVSFTGLFDFFVQAFGVEWLRWWEKGRPETEAGLVFKQKEQAYLEKWRKIVHETVWDYCDRHNIKRPNRCTTVQPSGTKSLLTGASPGWHPPKAVRFIRRVTFGKNDPVALACIDYGYSVVPSQSDKDENGNLLKDPFDERCTEWLVEIPVAVPWADLPGADEVDISKFSVLAQFDFAMQVQKHYVTHNTSATLELREHEIEDLGQAIYSAIKNNEGYISAALLARFDAYQTFPRLPFEPVDEATYNQLMREVEERRKMDDFHSALLKYDLGELSEAGPTGCDTDQCMFPLQ